MWDQSEIAITVAELEINERICKYKFNCYDMYIQMTMCVLVYLYSDKVVD